MESFNPVEIIFCNKLNWHKASYADDLAVILEAESSHTLVNQNRLELSAEKAEM